MSVAGNIIYTVSAFIVVVVAILVYCSHQLSSTAISIVFYVIQLLASYAQLTNCIFINNRLVCGYLKNKINFKTCVYLKVAQSGFSLKKLKSYCSIEILNSIVPLTYLKLQPSLFLHQQICQSLQFQSSILIRNIEFLFDIFYFCVYSVVVLHFSQKFLSKLQVV